MKTYQCLADGHRVNGHTPPPPPPTCLELFVSIAPWTVLSFGIMALRLQAGQSREASCFMSLFYCFILLLYIGFPYFAFFLLLFRSIPRKYKSEE